MYILLSFAPNICLIAAKKKDIREVKYNYDITGPGLSEVVSSILGVVSLLK